MVSQVFNETAPRQAEGLRDGFHGSLMVKPRVDIEPLGQGPVCGLCWSPSSPTREDSASVTALSSWNAVKMARCPKRNVLFSVIKPILPHFGLRGNGTNLFKRVTKIVRVLLLRWFPDLRAVLRCCCLRTTTAWPPPSSRIRRRTTRPQREDSAATLPHSFTRLPPTVDGSPLRTHAHTLQSKAIHVHTPPRNPSHWSIEALEPAVDRFLHFNLSVCAVCTSILTCLS